MLFRSLEMFNKINGNGQTVIIVTHDPEVGALARKTVHIRDGIITSID